MQVKIITIQSGAVVDHEVAGATQISNTPTIKEIIDAAEQCICGENADTNIGSDPYAGTLLRVVDGWLVVSDDGEGNLLLTHAKIER